MEKLYQTANGHGSLLSGLITGKATIFYQLYDAENYFIFLV